MAIEHKSKLSGDQEYALQWKKLDVVDNALHLIIPWSFLLAIAVVVYRGIDVLAGKTTMAQIGMSFIGDIKVSNALSYLFGAGGFGYGIKERRLRHKKTAGLTAYSAELERKIHSERTSSGLTPEGTTRPEDKR